MPPGAEPWAPGLVHEMGHAFGVGHASHWEGGTSILPGEHREGRDGLFMMGSDGNGVIVQQLTGEITRSLDFTPQSQGGVGTNEEDFIDTRDGALQIGSVYTFSGTGVAIEPLRTGTTDGLRWIEVNIDVGARVVRDERPGAFRAGDPASST